MLLLSRYIATSIWKCVLSQMLTCSTTQAVMGAKADQDRLACPMDVMAFL